MKFGLFVTVVTLSIGWNAAHAAPHASVTHPLYDFGAVPQGKKVEHAFIVRNTGDSPLAIKSIRPSCGCTAANASSPVVQPGKTAEIKVTFNSANFTGAVHKTIALGTDDPKAPVTTLTLKGSVIEEITVKPRQVNLGRLKAGSTTVVVVEVVNNGKHPVRLVSVRSPLPQVSVKMTKDVIKPGESAAINVTASPSRGDQMLSGYLTIRTDDPAKAEIIVPVYASIAK